MQELLIWENSSCNVNMRCYNFICLKQEWFHDFLASQPFPLKLLSLDVLLLKCFKQVYNEAVLDAISNKKRKNNPEKYIR